MPFRVLLRFVFTKFASVFSLFVQFFSLSFRFFQNNKKRVQTLERILQNIVAIKYMYRNNCCKLPKIIPLRVPEVGSTFFLGF